MQSATETPWMLYTPLTSSFKPLHCFSDPSVLLVLGVSHQLSPRGLSPKQKSPYRASSASNFQPPLTLKIFLLFYKASKPYSKNLSCILPGGRGEKETGSVHPSFWSPWGLLKQAERGNQGPALEPTVQQRVSESPLCSPRLTRYFGLQGTTTNFPALWWTFKLSLVCTHSSIYVSNH